MPLIEREAPSLRPLRASTGSVKESLGPSLARKRSTHVARQKTSPFARASMDRETDQQPTDSSARLCVSASFALTSPRLASPKTNQRYRSEAE